jgi:inosose dehydratase
VDLVVSETDRRAPSIPGNAFAAAVPALLAKMLPAPFPPFLSNAFGAIMNHLSRRHFVAFSSVGLASLAHSRWAVDVHAEAAKTGMKLGIQLFSLRNYSVDDALRHAKELGFEQVEFYSKMLPTNASAAEIATIKQKVQAQGLSISAHGVNKLTKDAAANRKLFEFAKELGIRNLTVDPDPDSLDNVNALVKEFDIRVAIHNHGPKHRYNKALDVLRAIEGRDERIGACADLGHFIRSGERPVDVIRLLKGRLYGVHLKDFAEMQDKAEGVVLGKGHLNCAEVFDAMRQTGFPSDGALSLEYEEHPENPLNEIRQCVAVAKAAL